MARLCMAVVMALNVAIYGGIAALCFGDYSNSLELHHLPHLVFELFQWHKMGEFAWQMLFAVHLVMLGRVMCTQRVTSRVLAALLVLGGLGYGLDATIHLLRLSGSVLSYLSALLLAAAVVGELWFAIWLIRGKAPLIAGKSSSREEMAKVR